MLRIVERDGRRELLDAGGRSVHSRHNPPVEGERQAAALELAPGTLLIVIGPGLGYMLPPLAARGDCRVVAVERAEILPQAPAGVAVVAPDSAEFSIADWQPERYRRVRVAHGPAYRHDPAYAAAEEKISRAIDRWAGEKVTQTAFGALWLENFAAQLRLNPALQAWRSPRATGHTAVIAAAGPSLNEAAAALRRFPGPVWAVDTAWPVLLRLGRLPELVVSNDPQAVSRKHFADYGSSAPAPPPAGHSGSPAGSLGKMRGGRAAPSAGENAATPTLLTCLTADPGVARRFERRLYYDDGYPLNRFFTELGGFLPAFSQAGGSAVMILYQLAVACGAKKVVMLGQDLAYPLAGGTHAAGTAYSVQAVRELHRFGSLENGERAGGKKGTKTVAGVSGPVAVSAPLEQYRLWLEQFIAAHPETAFINTATRGVAIAGARPAAVAEALAAADGMTLATDGERPLGRAAGMAQIRAWPQECPWFAGLPDRAQTIAALEK